MTTGDPLTTYKAAFVRIWDETGRAILGAGALATPEGLVLTCAHVVGRREAVRLDFPFLTPGERLTARVVRRDPEADLAALRLEGEPPAQARPMPFALAEDVWQHPFRTCGFPRGYDEGVWAKGVLLAPTGDRGWVQMEAERTTGFAVQRGFSGAPVWDDRLNAAVGLVVTAAGERETRAAFCIPVAQLVTFWPDLDKHARPPNPYRGLEPFREQDAANFFGREEMSKELAERVRRDSLTVVLGASGSGKSSLVQAGLIPRIRALPGWTIALARPTEDPFRELARVLVPLLEPDLTEVKRLAEINDLANNLATGRVTLDDVVRRILEKQAGEYFLLVVDQFEELFTLVDDRAVRRRYLDMLLDAGEKPSTPLHLVLVMRMDFLAESRRLDQSLREHHFLVTSMSDEELRRAIVEPARRAHVTFEPGLVERILEDVGDEPGNLPPLEFALTQLWERQEYRRLTHAAYEAIGGVKGALIRHAEEVFHSLTPEEQAEARRLFVQLVQPGEGTEDTRRRAHREQLGEKRWALARRLADERLVVTGGGDPAEPDYVEVAHEALIRHWPRLREWMREDREFRRWQERTRAQAARWREQGEPPGLLLQGRWLDEALDWLEKRKAEIEDTLAEYIRASQEERARRQAEEERRRRRLLQAVTGAAVFFLLLALLALWQWRLAVQRQRVAQARQLVITGQTLLQEDPHDNAPTAALLGAEAVRLSPSSEAYTLLNDALERLPRQVLGRYEHKGLVSTVAFSPDGKLVVSGSRDGTAVVWEAATGREVVRFEHKGPVTAVAFSPDGQWVVSGSRDGAAVVWEATTGRQVARFEHEDDVTAVAFSPDGKWVVSGSDDGTAVVWEAATGREVARFEHGDWVRAVAFSPDGEWVVSGGCEEGVGLICMKGAAAVVWEAATGREVARFEHEWGVNAVAFSPDGRWVVSGAGDGTAVVWEAATGREVARFAHEGGGVTAVAFSPDGKWVVSGSVDGAVVWEAATGRQVARFVHKGWVNAVAFSPDGKWVMSGSWDGTAVVWEAATGREVARFEHGDWVRAVAFSPDGKWVVSGSYDGTAVVWEAATGRQVARFEHEGGVNAVAFSPDGKWVVSGSADGTAVVWEATTGRQAARFEHKGRVIAVAFSPDGKWVMSGSWDAAVVWEAATGREVARFVHKGPVTAVAFSPNGKWVVSGGCEEWNNRGCTKSAVVVWEAVTGREVARFVHKREVTAVAFSLDGRWVVSGGCAEVKEEKEGWLYCTKGAVVVWEAATGRAVARFEHGDEVTAMAFSPDGKWVVSGSRDGTAVVWEAATGRQVARFVHGWGVTAVAFSPDGKWVVSGAGDGTAVVWEAATGRQVARFVHGDTVNAVAFSPDGKWVVSGSNDGTAVVWEAATGREVARFVHKGWVNAVAFSPDGKWVVSGSGDGTAVVWWVGLRIEEEICLHISSNLTATAWQRYVGDLPYHPTCPNRPIPQDAQQAMRAYRQRRGFWAAAVGVLVLGLALAGFGRQRASLFAGFMGVAVSAIAGIAIWQAVNAWMYSTSLVQDALLGIGMVASAGWLLWPWKIRLQRRLFWFWILAFWFATAWWGWEWLFTFTDSLKDILKEVPLSPLQWVLLGLTWLGAGLLVTLSALALDDALFFLYRRVRPRLGA